MTKNYMRLIIIVIILGILAQGTVSYRAAADTSPLTAFITRFYELCLSRKPDSSGLTFWTTQLKSGQKTGADVGRDFILSKEFVQKNVSDEIYISILYKAFFD